MSSDPGTLGPERTTTQLFFLAHCHSEGCTRQRIQPPRPAIPSVPLYRFVDHSFYFILFEEKKISFYKETSVLAIGVRNVQCVGVHESRSRRGEHVNLATSISRHAPNGFFYFFFLNILIERTSRFLVVLETASTRPAFQVYHQRVVRPDQRRIFLPSGSISQVSLTSTTPFWETIPYFWKCHYFLASSWNARNWPARRLKFNDTTSW